MNRVNGRCLRLKTLTRGSRLLRSYEWTTAAPTAPHARTHSQVVPGARNAPRIALWSPLCPSPSWTAHGLYTGLPCAPPRRTTTFPLRHKDPRVQRTQLAGWLPMCRPRAAPSPPLSSISKVAIYVWVGVPKFNVSYVRRGCTNFTSGSLSVIYMHLHACTCI